MDEKRGRGRPPKPPEDTKGDVLHLRVGQDERAAYQETADRNGMPLSEWVRDRLNRAVKRETKK